MALADVTTTSPAKTVAAVEALRSRAEADDRYVVEEFPNSPPSFRILMPRPHGGRTEIVRVLVFEGCPIEIFDGGRRRGTKISVATANQKLDSPFGTYRRGRRGR